MTTTPIEPAIQALRALIVDDDPRWRAIIAEVLSELGWSITAMATPPDDIRGYHLAVLDIALDPILARNREGLELIKHVTALGTACVVLSGLEDDDLVSQVKQLPNVLDFIPKTSFRRDTFIALVGHAARGAPAVVAAPHLLIVEDDAGWRGIYEDVLSEEGYVLHSAISYGEARGWLQREEIALAIVDLHLISSAAPQDNRDGFWFLRAAHHRGIPTIVVSALGAPDDVDRAYEEYNAFAFVEKEGFDRREFRRMIAAAIRAHPRDAQPADATLDQKPAIDSPLSELTDRERDVLELLVKGDTNRQIADALGITANTVKKHVDHILQKLQVSTRAAAVAVAMRAERN
jgi:DNA-binding NarL/FixJ family response regulator